MHQQLCFNAVDSRRLLQSLDHVRQQPRFYIHTVGSPISVRYEKIANYALAAFVYEERISHDSSPLYRRITGQDLGIYIAQDHIGRSVVVPGEHARPQAGLFV